MCAKNKMLPQDVQCMASLEMSSFLCYITLASSHLRHYDLTSFQHMQKPCIADTQYIIQYNARSIYIAWRHSKFLMCHSVKVSKHKTDKNSSQPQKDEIDLYRPCLQFQHLR